MVAVNGRGLKTAFCTVMPNLTPTACLKVLYLHMYVTRVEIWGVVKIMP